MPCVLFFVRVYAFTDLSSKKDVPLTTHITELLRFFNYKTLHKIERNAGRT